MVSVSAFVQKGCMNDEVIGDVVEKMQHQITGGLQLYDGRGSRSKQ